jgi:cell division protein FtsI (penicillin-binding protein 3)
MTKDQGFSISQRLKWAGIFAVLCTLAVQVRLFQLQILEHIPATEEGNSVVNRSFVWKASRGLIVDRNGRKLVSNSEFQTLVAHPHDIPNPELVAQALSEVLGISPDVLETRLTSKYEEQAIKRKLPAEALKRLRDLRIPGTEADEETSRRKRPNPKLEHLHIPGLALLEEPSRYYLKNELAGQVLGWVDIDNIGQAGVERYARDKLKGTTTTVQVRKYGDHRSILTSDYTRSVPIRGADVVLTIDETIQWIVERALWDQCTATEAKSGTAIVMEPTTGEVLAMANYPAFSPEKVGDYAANREMGRAKNHCIADLFEPGSTLKPFVVAAGLDCGAITTETLIDCENGRRYLASKYRSKPIEDEHPLGIVPVGQVLVHSSNIGAGKIAELIVGMHTEQPNKKLFNDYLSAFGFGEATGIDLPGESNTIIRPGWQDWNLNDLLVLAFGTGPIMVTPVTLARAYCVLANGGVRVSPRVIRGFIGNRSGEFYEKKVSERLRIIHPKVAHDVLGMLVQVVETGHSKAKSDLYLVGGKTGTAKKVIDGRYSQDHRLLSFAGFAPAHQPRMVVVVMIDEPQGMRFGNEAAAPVFKRIVEETLAYLHVPPDKPEVLEKIREKAAEMAMAELDAQKLQTQEMAAESGPAENSAAAVGTTTLEERSPGL